MAFRAMSKGLSSLSLPVGSMINILPGVSEWSSLAFHFLLVLLEELPRCVLLVFRWFKFTLKPPYSGAHEHSLLAIWDTSHWNFLSNLVSGQLETSLMTSYCHF